jgi:chromosomal replication initiator protein
VRGKSSREFRRRYRKLDLLAIDDVHFLAAKRATQEEFLHTFNAIESAGKQIILASDAHPRMVGDLNEQLVSRFLAGMVVKIDPPDRETRLRVLQHKARSMKFSLSNEVAEYLAQQVRGSVRELEGTLVKLMALAALENGKVTVALARDALADHLARTDSAVTLGDIEAGVAAFFGITPADIHSSRRTRTVSAARMVAMYLARRHTRMSSPEIGQFMGKNHSSVVLAVQRLESLLARGAEIVWNTPVGTKTMPAEELVNVLNEQVG